jgi:hypothetical protein
MILSEGGGPAVALLVLLAAHAAASPGDWSEPRRDPHLTAFQPLPGDMREAPEELATLDLGRHALALTPVRRPDGSTVGLLTAAGALQCWDAEGNRLWEAHPEGLNFTQIVSAEDLDGDGCVEVLLQAGRPAHPYGAAVLVSLDDGRVLWRYDVDPVSYEWYLYAGRYLPRVSTKQIIVLMQGYPPDEGLGFMALFASETAGAPPVQRWRYDFDHYTCFPGLFKVDVDGDGAEELAIETHSHMWLLDPTTGAPRQYLEWDVAPANIRSYGLTRFMDVDGDGLKDFVVIANFAQHHEVLLNQGGTFVEAWHHGWGENVTTGKVETTWPEPPVADVDGDGRGEMIVSMYNSEGESNWLVRVYDVLTGELKYGLPGIVAVGVFDLDDDGRVEILANATSDPTRGKLAGAHLLRVTDGALGSVWSDAAAVAVKSRGPSGDDRVPSWNDTLLPVTSPAGPLPLVRRADGTLLRLVVGGETDAAAAPLGSLDGQALHGVPWQPPADPAAVTPPAPPQVVNIEFRELLAADVDGDGRHELLSWYPNICRVYKLQGGTLVEVGAYETDALPAVADFDGDGVREIAVVRVRDGDTPRVEALSPARGGQALWQHQLPPAEHQTLPWASRPAYLRAGRFTGRSGFDLYLFAGVPVVRSLVLDGATGAIVWERSEMPELQRYWGPTMNLTAVHDTNADGRDELVFTNPDYYCVADGQTGDLILGPLAPPQVFDQPSMGLYTMPVLLDQPTGEPTVCLAGGHYFQGAMSLSAAPSWYSTPATGEARCSREGFVRGLDGAWLMGFGRQNGRFACVEVATGALRWEFDVGASCTDIAACDVNGDGVGEFVFGTSHGHLYAVADAGDRGQMVWRKDLGAPARLVGYYADYSDASAGRPIIADLNGDGRSEIVIQTADGRIHVLGSN